MLIIIIIVFILTIINYKSLLRLIKKEEHLEYSNINYIGVKLDMQSEVIDIYDIDVINAILKYLNSMTLIKEEIPRKYQVNYIDDYEKYMNRLENCGYFIMSISDSLLCFSNEYVSVTYDGYNYTSYFVIDSGFNSETNTSKFHEFLYDMLRENVEDE